MEYGFSFALKDYLSSPFSRMTTKVNAGYTQMAQNQSKLHTSMRQTGTLASSLSAKLRSLEVKRTIELDDKKVKLIDKQIDNLKGKLSTLTHPVPVFKPQGLQQKGGSGTGFGSDLIGATGLSRFTGINPLVGGGLAIGAAATYGAKLGMDLQDNISTIQQFTGSVSSAQKVVEQLNKYADRTAYENNDIMKSGAFLLQNIGQQKLMSRLSAFGDISMGKSEKMDYLIRAYSQVKGKGKLKAEEANQFEENLVPIRNEIAKYKHIKRAVLDDMIEKGQISFEDVDKTLMAMTSKGGQYFGMMDKLANNTRGKLSTLFGSLKSEFAKLSMQNFDGLNSLIDFGIRFTKNINYATTGIRDFITANRIVISQIASINQHLFAVTDNAALLSKGIGRFFHNLGEPIRWVNWWLAEIKNGAWATYNAISGIFGKGKELFSNFQQAKSGKKSWLDIFDTPESASKKDKAEQQRKQEYNSYQAQAKFAEQLYQAQQNPHTKASERRSQRNNPLQSDFAESAFKPSDIANTQGGKTANGTTATTGGSVKNITINIAKMVEKIEVYNESGRLKVESIRDAIHSELTAIVASAAQMGVA